MPTCYSKDFIIIFRYYHSFHYKCNNNLQSLSNRIILNYSFRYLLDYIKYVILNISIRQNIFPDIWNKGIYGVLFKLTQDTYLHTPVYLYALHIPILVRIATAYIYIFSYSAILHAVKHKEVCRVLNYVDQSFIGVSTIIGCVSISVFASLVVILIGIMVYAIGLKICVITA